MAKQGAKPPKLDPEEAFGFWYADGSRRTYGQVAARFGVHYNTVRNAADEHDWDGRADGLDEKAREIADRRLAHLRAQATLRIAEVAMTGIVKFTQRLPEKIQDPSDPSKMIANPHALEPGELTSMDLYRFVKVLESVGVVGSSDGDAPVEQLEALEDLRAQVAAMYAAEVEDGEWEEAPAGELVAASAGEITAGAGGNPDGPGSAVVVSQVRPRKPRKPKAEPAPADSPD